MGVVNLMALTTGLHKFISDKKTWSLYQNVWGNIHFFWEYVHSGWSRNNKLFCCQRPQKIRDEGFLISLWVVLRVLRGSLFHLLSVIEFRVFFTEEDFCDYVKLLLHSMKKKTCLLLYNLRMHFTKVFMQIRQTTLQD